MPSNDHQFIDPERMRKKLAAGNRPYVILKAAATLDGKIATRTGESQWITGEAARAHAHGLRAVHDAVLVGIGTVLADDPRLTVRHTPDGATSPVQPARVVLDSRARIDPDARCLAGDGARRIVVTGQGAPAKRVRILEERGVEVWRFSTRRPQAAGFLPRLRAEGLSTVLVEGGAGIHGYLIAEKEADELVLYMAGMLIGDPKAPDWCGRLGTESLSGAARLLLSPPRMLGDDVLLRGIFRFAENGS